MAIQEGTIARNPETNERIVLKNGSWQPIESENAVKPTSGLGTAAKTGIAAAQGLTFGFADELAGTASKAFGGDYEKTRDRVRLSQEEFKKDYPIGSVAAELVGSAPTLLLPGGQIRGASMAAKAGRILAPAIGYGALGGAGASTEDTASGIASDALFGGTIGAGAGATGSVAGKVVGAVGKKAGELFSERFAVNPARERLIQLLQRDAEAKMLPAAGLTQEGPTRAAARLRALGSPTRAPIAATGRNTLSELDVLSQLPGSADTLLRREQARLRNSRGPTLVAAAEQSLGTTGRRYDQSLEMFNLAKQAESAPFYDQLKGLVVQVDPELRAILDKVKKAHGAAEEIATLSGKPMKVSDLDVGTISDFSSLDNIKKALWDISSAAERKGETYKAGLYGQARRELTAKLDQLSPKENGQSIYKMARDAFSGPAAMEQAATEGSRAMTMGVDDLSRVLANLEGAEVEAFRIGAVQSLRNQLGEKAGQTKIIDSFDSGNTKQRLRKIFGNDFKEFNKAILQERELKELDRVGAGSQTFKRQAAAEDQGLASQALDAASSMSAANPIATLSMLSKSFKRLGMPENTRNELARMLLLKGPRAQQELQEASRYMRQKQLSKEQADKLAGLLGAQAARDF